MTKITELVDHTNLPSIVRMELLSGVAIDVTPVTQATLIGIDQKAEATFKFDDSKYRKPLPGAAVEGQTYIDEDDPDYKRDLNRVKLQRDLWSKLALYRIAIKPTPPVTKLEVVEKFKPQLDELREVMDLPSNDWDAILAHLMFSYRDDQIAIDRLLLRNAPISFSEVADGLRVFRLKVQKPHSATVDESGSSEPEREQDDSEHS